MKILFLFSGLIVLSNLQAQTLNAEQRLVKQVVVDFYKWYSVNDAKLYNFKLYKGKNKKDVPPYIIDWKVAETYFTYIRKNVPWLGEAFIENERKFLKQCQQSFNKYPEEEMPIGFDYDRFTDTQEDAKYTLSETILNKKMLWQINIKSNNTKAVVFISEKQKTDERSKIELVKEKGLWKISKCISRNL